MQGRRDAAHAAPHNPRHPPLTSPIVGGLHKAKREGGKGREREKSGGGWGRRAGRNKGRRRARESGAEAEETSAWEVMAPGRPRLRLPRFSALQHVSVLPDVWRMCSFTVCLSFLLCQVYNPIRRAVRDGQKKTLLFYVFHDCDAFFNMCTTFVTFILSFFNATVFTRWWRLRELCGTVNGQTVCLANRSIQPMGAPRLAKALAWDGFG